MGSVIEIVNAIIEVLTVLYFFKQTLRVKPMSKYARAGIIAGVSVIHIARSFFPIPTYYNIALTFALWSVFLICLFDDSTIKRIVMILIYIVVCIMCDMIDRLLVASIFNSAYTAESVTGIQRYIFMAVNTVLMFSLLSVAAMSINRSRSSVPLKYWIMLLMFPIFSLLIVISTDAFMIMANVNEMKYIVLLLVIVIGLLYFNVTIFGFIDSYSAKLQLAAAEELIEKQTENYRLLERNEKDLRYLRHNINNHMEVMRNMIDNNKISEPQEFMSSLESLSVLPLGTVYTNDITLDSILNVEGKKAAERGIKYIVKTQRLTAPLCIEQADKSTILCNAIENAIEAAEKTDEKFVVIEISSDEQHIKICIENSSQPVTIKNNSIETTKKNRLNHGLGLKSISQTIKKYRGHLNISYENGITSLVMLLNNQTK